jgi:hypothetical protein
MPCSMTKLRFAHEKFIMCPNKQTAGVYLALLVDAESEGSINDDEFLNGVAEVSHWLLR